MLIRAGKRRVKPNFKGFQGKILHIDLIGSRHWVVEITDEVFSTWLGGRRLGCYLLWQNLKAGDVISGNIR
jgi:aldehyde:ferredoxin oxidoreductase